MKKAKPYLLAFSVCLIELIIFVIIAALLGWKNGGGIIPIMIILSIIAFTWKTITGAGQQKDNHKSTEDKTEI